MLGQTRVVISWMAVLVAVTAVRAAAGQRAQEEGEPVGRGDEAAAKPAIARFELVGADSVDEAELRNLLATKAPSWIPWTRTPRFDPDALDQDLRRITTFYGNHGYPDARIPEVAIDHTEDGVAITIRIEAGEPNRVADVELTGFSPLPPETLSRLRQQIPVLPGEPVVREDVVAGAQLGIESLEEHGYAHATVNVDQREVAPRRVRIRYEAVPGPLTRFGEVQIGGNLDVSDELIRREVAFTAGEPFQRSLVVRTQQALLALGLFEAVAIERVTRGPTGEQATDIGIRIRVVERDPQRVEFGFGYGTDEQVWGDLEWQHLNFAGGGRRLGARGRWSWLDRGVRAQFRQPFFLTRHLTLMLDGRDWHTQALSYDTRLSGGSAGVGGTLGTRTSWSAILTTQQQRSQASKASLADPALRQALVAIGFDPTSGEQRGVLNQVGFQVLRSTIDEPARTRRSLVSLQVEGADRWLGGDFSFVQVQAGGRAYWDVGDHVLMARLEAGSIDPTAEAPESPENGGSPAVPFFKRYFLGGSTSLRGWGYDEVSALSPEGVPIGGHSMLLATLEARFQLAGPFGMAVFVDAGNVWATSWHVRPSDMRYDAGIGFQFRSPFGPIRVDLGYPLTPIEGLRVDGREQDQGWRIHLRVGE